LVTWRTPLVVITAGCLIALISFGVRAGFGLFLAPMSADLGWGREVFALAIAIQNIMWGLGQPVAGAIADRYGSGRVLAIGGLVYAAGVYLMAVTTTPLMFHMSAGVLVGLGLSGASFAVVLAAFGIGTAAGSLGQFLMVPLGQAFMSAYGWSVALMLLSLFALLMIPLAGALTGRPPSQATTRDQSLREALREAGGHSSYLYLTSGFFVCGFHVAFIQTHLPAYLTDAGIAAAVGAWALSLVGLFNIVGSYVSGMLGGRYSKKYLLSSLYLSRAVAIAVFVLVPVSETSALVFASVMGLLWLSTVPLTSGLVAQMFGLRYMATLFGIVFFSHQMGAFTGVWLGGYLFDTTGSYDVVWWVGVALGVLAAVLHFPIDERPVEQLAKA
jgi:predicted MFS family arabinose efflux permease